MKTLRYYVKTFGCQQNKADSERVSQAFEGRGMKPARGYVDSNYVIINTCMVRENAENRVYGLIENLAKLKEEKLAKGETFKIIVTGCMVGVAFRDKSGKYMEKIRRVMPEVDEFMPIEEVGFDHAPLRYDKENAWVPISNGCNNFCTFCIVPFTRGREISRPYDDIIEECKTLKAKRYKTVTLLGQNVNSYGADLIIGEQNIHVMRDIDTTYFKDTATDTKTTAATLSTLRTTLTYNGRAVEPVYVKHLGRQRIPTLFPYLLEDVARMDFEKVDFVSSNPWDFSDELIDVISRYPNITRTIHLPIQSGDNAVLKRMNRWYTREEYMNLIDKMRSKVPDIKFTTDIIVGFCDESDEEFKNTKDLAEQVGFDRAFISIYSQRPMTAATKVFIDSVPHPIKKQRWLDLESMINHQYH
ncbi:MAG: MiaB/RimO family radical SAM methylthiotransferase [Weeksellaceae bacterium]